MTSSQRRRGQQQQPAFVETDFTVPLTTLDRTSTPGRYPHAPAEYYVIASRDQARPAHSGSGTAHTGGSDHARMASGPAHTAPGSASRRFGGGSRTCLPTPPASRPAQRSLSHAAAYSQRRDRHGVLSPLAGSDLLSRTTTDAAFVLLPSSSASLARSQGSRSQGSRHVPGSARSSGMPGLVLQQYRPIQPKPSPPPRYVADMVVEGRSRVMSSDSRRTSAPASFAAAWSRAESGGGGGAPVLNVPRVPAAAHGVRPLPAAHAVRGSGGSVPGSAGLSLTIDDQAPLDCSRKSGGGGAGELDVPTVLNLTTSGPSHGNSERLQQPPGLPPKNSTTEEDHPTALPLLSSLVLSDVEGGAASSGGSAPLEHAERPPSLPVKDSTVEQLSEQSQPTGAVQPGVDLTTSGQDAAPFHGGSAPLERIEGPPASLPNNSTIEQLSEPTAVRSGQRDIEMTLNDIEDVQQSASSPDRTRDTTVTLGDLEQPTETKASDMTLSVLDEVKPVLAGLPSNAVTLLDLERAQERIGTTSVDMTLGDLGEVKSVPVDSAPSDVTPAPDRRDLETTSDDLGNLRTEQSMETNADDLWKDELHSPASEGFFVSIYNTQRHILAVTLSSSSSSKR